MTDPELRQQVLERDDYICQNCDSSKHLDIHHLIPKLKEGKDVLENLITLCRSCHKILEFIDIKQIPFPARFIAKVRRSGKRSLVRIPRKYNEDAKRLRGKYAKITIEEVSLDDDNE